MVTIRNNIVCGPEESMIPAHLSFGQYLFDRLKRGGDQRALICADTGDSVTYRYILQKSVNLAVKLQQLGLRKGDVVVLSSENRFEFIVATLAIIYAGGELSTLNITYSPGEVSHILSITKPKFIFTSPIAAQNLYDASESMPCVEKIIIFGEYEVIPALKYNDLINDDIDIDTFELVDVNGLTDTMGIMCSSGTTGLPKGVMLTHVNFLTLARHLNYYLEESVNKEKIKMFMSLIPWFHAYGFITTLTVMSFNVEIVFLVRFEETQFLETIQSYKVNMTMIVPPLAVFLAKHPLVLKYDLSSLVDIWCGAAPLSSEIQSGVQKRIGIKNIRQGYGLTEVTMACCVDLTDGHKPGSCGTPAPGMKIKVLDLDTGKIVSAGQKGELWIKSPLRMKGYKGDLDAGAALFDADGFVRTGDIGHYDKDGFFYIVDRLKELIKYKGFQVAPAELEALLLQHGGVAECGVVGMPDELAGELPTAFVVRQHGSNVTEKELVQHVASKVSPAKHLKGGVFFIKEIPKNASGKILRRELKELLNHNVKSKL